MTEKEKKYLSDISHSILLIESFTLEIKSFSDYRNDLKTKSAVERHLAIIGEAVNKFLKESETNSFKNSTQIVSLRNRIIHSYDNIDDSIVWAVLSNYLAALKDEVKEKLG